MAICSDVRTCCWPMNSSSRDGRSTASVLVSSGERRRRGDLHELAPASGRTDRVTPPRRASAPAGRPGERGA